MKEKEITATNYVAIASTLQENQKDVATQINLPPEQTIVKSVNRYKTKFENALPHIPHGKDFQFPEEFKDSVAFNKKKMNPKKIIIFASTEMLLLLENTKHLWLGDRDFK